MASIKEYFIGAGGKYLALVDTPSGSHQSEIGKASVFSGFLGSEARKKKEGKGFPATFFWMPDSEEERITFDAVASWYDSREGKPDRDPEWRLYYGRNNPVMKNSKQGDLCIVAMKPDRSLVVLVSPVGSSTAIQLAALFYIPYLDPLGDAAALAQLNTSLDAFSRLLLEEMNIVVSVEETGLLTAMLKAFKGRMPDTLTMSTYARSTARRMNALDDPDAALLGWFEWEDKLFRELESKVVGDDVQEHLFDKTGSVNVEALTQFFLGVHNRRKSRAGHAFAHHIRAVFDAHGLLYQSEVVTENSKKLDFLLPNGFLYHNPAIPAHLLTALGAKTTCKDRWRQVLSEAHKIPDKHLITLESPITSKQLDEMASERLRLVIPKGRHWAFQSQHPANFPLSVIDFIQMVKSREDAIRNGHAQILTESIEMVKAAGQAKKPKKAASKKKPPKVSGNA